MLSYFRRPETIRAFFLYWLVLAGVETIVTWYYWNAGYERVRFELIMSAIIATVVGVPAIAFYVRQHIALSDLNQRLAYLSVTDRMTNLLNRQAFIEQLDCHLIDHGRNGSAGVLAYIDADHFKMLNDRFGHDFGDRVITLLAERIRSAARPDDLCARLGGEEFGIFLKNVTLDESAVIAETLRRDVELAGLRLNTPGHVISVSIGLAAHRQGLEAVEIMREADRSLYAAKHGGRNAVVIELKHHRVA